jgi:hypothetical protein
MMSVSFKFLRENIDSLIDELPIERDYAYWLANPERAFNKRFYLNSSLNESRYIDILGRGIVERSYFRYKLSHGGVSESTWESILSYIQHNDGLLIENLQRLSDI